MRIAIQGMVGAFHEFAARQWCGQEPLTFVYCDTFREAFAKVEAGDADKAVVAIENSLYGSINEVYDLLQKHHEQLVIQGEIMLHIHQQLIGLPGAKLETIREVYSQDVALAQCEAFIAATLPQATTIAYHDTAASVAHIKQLADPTFAAIASQFSAREYGMPIIAKNIEDNPQNYTRFVVLAPPAAPTATDAANKASLILITNHSPGALHRALGVFARHGANLTGLHSRPLIKKVWRHKFYIDIDCVGETLQAIIAQLESQEATVVVLGEYSAAITMYDT